MSKSMSLSKGKPWALSSMITLCSLCPQYLKIIGFNLNSEAIISNDYMCSTPSLPSVTAWFTSFTNTKSWKFSPASVDLSTFNRCYSVNFGFTLATGGDGAIRKMYPGQSRIQLSDNLLSFEPSLKFVYQSTSSFPRTDLLTVIPCSCFMVLATWLLSLVITSPGSPLSRCTNLSSSMASLGSKCL